MNKDDFEELIFIWEEYGKASDNILTVGAIALKKKVIEFVLTLPELDEDLKN